LHCLVYLVFTSVDEDQTVISLTLGDVKQAVSSILWRLSDFRSLCDDLSIMIRGLNSFSNIRICASCSDNNQTKCWLKICAKLLSFLVTDRSYMFPRVPSKAISLMCQ
jgi:hypothetical protein